MKNINMKIILLIVFILFIGYAKAQDAIKNVIVETYYISDAKDATDTIGGYLEPGSKTYRIYVQLRPGCKLLSIYGDKNNALKISSTAEIFNHKTESVTFGKDINAKYLKNNTVGLDSWITLGQVTKKSTSTYFGILKTQDSDGSLIGGINNDGGSGKVPGGLLTNNDAMAGIPLTNADGMDTLANVASNWVHHGFIDLVSGEDSTIFGSVKSGTEFISNDAYLSNTGVMGVNPDSNQVLIAQLTTKGEISFELNLQVLDPKANQSYRSLYVANGVDSILEAERSIVKVSPYLKYPPACGCTDPNFLEYSTKYICGSADQCKTRIVLGCMDPTACNYNPDANYNVVYLCCYPGKCYDRDLSLACPSDEPILRLDLYPNPAVSRIFVKTTTIEEKETKYAVYNYYGRLVLEKNLGLVNGTVDDELDISKFEPGIYVVRLVAGNAVDSRIFIKN
jgi:hypothetical protein